MTSNALARRLSKLQRGQIFSILAVDHALSSGAVRGLEDIARWSEFADQVGIAAVVANYGAARNMPGRRKHALILQMVGAPRIVGKKSARRVPNATIEEAIRLDADCISVQVDFTHENLDLTLSEISVLRNQAHEYNLPVLFMITTPPTKFKSSADIVDAVKVCDELGADLVKVAYDCQTTTDHSRLFVDKSTPPVVLAGGKATGQFLHTLGQARQLGFSGYCIGRNIFQSTEPEKIFDRIEAAFQSLE